MRKISALLLALALGLSATACGGVYDESPPPPAQNSDCEASDVEEGDYDYENCDGVVTEEQDDSFWKSDSSSKKKKAKIKRRR